MAEASAQDVVNEAQSMSEQSFIGVPGNNFSAVHLGEGDEELLNENSLKFNTYADSSASATHSIFPPTSTSPTVEGEDKQDLNDVDNSTSVDHGLVNGADAVSYTGSEDAGYQNLIGTEDSVNSDPDQSKTEGHESSFDPSRSHDRLGSIKRPAAFKAVSVTKNFLAKSGATPATITKLSGDRASFGSQSATASSQTARPRLVAKTGKDTRSLNLGVTPSSGSGPDASTVWNRNRPAPPPPPKQFTDEELKQQYGIHMATRLQADEAGKESKWADIDDDDEDDWAPETVQWMDGTKSTLLSTDNPPTPSKSEPHDQPPPASEEAIHANSPSSQLQTSMSSVGKTILRPGGAARVASQTKPGLVLRSVPDKPAQPENQQTHQAIGRSPWAQLPPVDKSVPITFHPPPASTSAPTPPAQRDSLVQEDESSAVSSAREIAADDFDRSWRDLGDRSGRELFNSQSGRYEPVKSVRRGSRNDQGFRPPAVLQRPSQQPNHAPSGEHTAGLQSRPWAARRGSSSYGTNNIQDDRRSSNEQEVQPSFPKEESEPTADDSRQSTQPPFQSGSPNAYSVHAPDPNRPATSEPGQDPRVLQHKLMRERIELNRRRKQEEEAKEEAERKERIRVKMESLGPPAQIKAAEQALTDNQQSSTVSEDQAELSTSLHTLEQTDPQAITNEPGQFSKLQIRSPELPTTAADHVPSSQSQLSSTRTQPNEHAAKKSLSDSNLSSAITPEVQQLPGLGQPMRKDHRQAAPSWNRMPHSLDPSNNWTNKSGSTNVWGAPSSDRPLGNGAFENEVNRVPAMQFPSGHPIPQSQLRSSPILPSLTFEGAHPTPSPPPHLQTLNENFPHHPPSASPISQPRPFLQPQQQQPQQQQQQQQQQLIHSQSRQNHQNFQQERSNPRDLSAAKAAWANFPAQLQMEEAEHRERTNMELNAKQAEEDRTGVKQDFQPTYHETFRQTVPSDVLGQRNVVSVTHNVHEGNNQGFDPRGVNAGGQAPYAQRALAQASPVYSTVNGRASRFFGPSMDRGLGVPGTTSFDDQDMFPGPPSPPPPESTDHPVNAGRSKQPLVKIRVLPTVKLPEPGKIQDTPSSGHEIQAKTTAQQPPVQPPTPQTSSAAPKALQISSGPVQMPALSRNRSGQGPIVDQIDWQDRFSALFKNFNNASSASSSTKTNPSKSISSETPAAPVSSSTKSLFEPSPPQAATVSLPQGSEESRLRYAGVPFAPETSIETKPTEEELVDEREFGSAPTVHLFKGIHPREQAIMPDCPPVHLSMGATNPIAYLEKANRDFVSTAHVLSFDYLDEELFVSSGIRIKVHLLGKPATERVLPKKVNAHFHSQARKQRPRAAPPPPRKPLTLTRGTRGESAGINKSAHSIGRPTSMSEGQQNENAAKTNPTRKKHEERKMSPSTPSTPTAKSSPTPDNSVDTPAVQTRSERPKTKTQWAKAPRSVRGKKSLTSQT